MFAECVVVRVLDFVEVVLIQLADERSEVGVLEHPGEDALCELVHVLDDEAVAVRTPRDDVRERRVLEHS